MSNAELALKVDDSPQYRDWLRRERQSRLSCSSAVPRCSYCPWCFAGPPSLTPNVHRSAPSEIC